MPEKNIYTVRILEKGDLPELLKEKAGRLSWLIVLQPDAQWSAEAVIPDLALTDQFDLDIIFDDDFRKTTDVTAGDRLNIDLGIADKKAGIKEVEVIAVRKDKPINHLQNKQ